MAHEAQSDLNSRYDKAASVWHDKMRVLGYYDGYLGFLSQPGNHAKPKAARVCDVGCGTAAFADAWVAVNGPPSILTLLDPSPQMLERGASALARRGVQAELVCAALGQDLAVPKFDELLASHLIEHCPDPLTALRQLHGMLEPGGTLRLVVSKPHWCNAIIWLQWRHRTFTPDEMRSLLYAAGFSVQSEYSFPSGPPSRTSMGFVAIT